MDNKELSRKPPDTAFQQQRLKAWQPLLTPRYVIITFLLTGGLFMCLGVIILRASNQVYEQTIRYDNVVGNSVNFTITREVEPPIYVYYQLTNFYQNHRRYVKSRSEVQLRGDGLDTSGCDPLESWNGSKLYPCGLVANSVFNDTLSGSVTQNGITTDLFKITDNTGCVGPNCWFETEISWESDRTQKFKQISGEATTVGPNTDGSLLPNVTDEHFIVWMRTAGLPTFKKLYARLPELKLEKGDVLTIEFDDQFAVSSFGGEKAIVISTTTWLGGKNIFLGWVYVVVASMCLVLGIVFLMKHKLSPRNLGSMQYFNWPGSSRQD